MPTYLALHIDKDDSWVESAREAEQQAYEHCGLTSTDHSILVPSLETYIRVVEVGTGPPVVMIESAGLELVAVQENTPYEFLSERAANACQKYGCEEILAKHGRNVTSPAFNERARACEFRWLFDRRFKEAQSLLTHRVK